MKTKKSTTLMRLRTTVLMRQLLIIVLTVLIVTLLSHRSFGQDGLHADGRVYGKENKRFYKSLFRKQRVQYTHACGLLERKRNQRPKKVFFASHSKRRPMAEMDATTVTAKVTPKPQPVSQPKPTPKPEVASKPVSNTPPINPKIEHITDKKLEELHKKEEDVLAKNDLPLPTSQKQTEVRKIVSDKLASKTNVYPLNLAPLYFNFDQDEFSVVDMEPFLIAAEYALQGRTVLIEGHTDNRGADDYNVKLSIKRVQKIRQLMLDMGVPDDRISIVGYGEELKVNDNKTADGRLRNRRVDFTIF